MASDDLAECGDEQKLTADDALGGDRFGVSVAAWGEVVVVGAYLDRDNGFRSGSAYVYRWDGTAWVQEQKLVASDGAVGDVFGVTVAIRGGVIVVGAPGAGSDGAVYVYRRKFGKWIEEQKLVPSVSGGGASFGGAVAIGNNALFVGAQFDSATRNDMGAVYVYRRRGTRWVEEQKLLASDGAAGDRFGSSVAAEGNVLVVGAWFDDLSASNEGSAYVFRSKGGFYQEEQKLVASDGASNDWFGASVAAGKDVVVVGAYVDDHVAFQAGSAYVYVWDGTAWVEHQKLVAPDAGSQHYFGISLAIRDDRLVIGVQQDDDNGNQSGSVWIYRWDGIMWIEQQKLIASDGMAGDWFGRSVATTKEVLAVGAVLDDDAGRSSGSAYVYLCGDLP